MLLLVLEMHPLDSSPAFARHVRCCARVRGAHPGSECVLSLGGVLWGGLCYVGTGELLGVAGPLQLGGRDLRAGRG